MINPGDIISYTDMCQEENLSLERGMNFQVRGGSTIILMSTRRGAPYDDRVQDKGRVLIYEGHNVPRKEANDPKSVDQVDSTPKGTPTQNGLFFRAAIQYKTGETGPEFVKVYEKIKSGLWVYNGIFRLVDAWQESSGGRKVFKFKLELTDEIAKQDTQERDLDHNRLIPSHVKLEVWKRDKGQCQHPGCDKKDNLHFDHIIPYSKGGSSLVAKNIQLLCARHNLAKRDKIE